MTADLIARWEAALVRAGKEVELETADSPLVRTGTRRRYAKPRVRIHEIPTEAALALTREQFEALEQTPDSTKVVAASRGALYLRDAGGGFTALRPDGTQVSVLTLPSAKDPDLGLERCE